MEKTQKIQVLYLDDRLQGWARGLTKTLLEGETGAQVTFKITVGDFYRLIESGDATRFEVVILHLGFGSGNSEKVVESIHRHLPEARFGIISDADEGEQIAREYSPDFFIFFQANDFLVDQVRKGAITEREKRWRGEYFLTPEALIDGDEQPIVRRERE